MFILSLSKHIMGFQIYYVQSVTHISHIIFSFINVSSDQSSVYLVGYRIPGPGPGMRRKALVLLPKYAPERTLLLTSKDLIKYRDTLYIYSTPFISELLQVLTCIFSLECWVSSKNWFEMVFRCKDCSYASLEKRNIERRLQTFECW